jgi:2-C-methyl-D-erythritol 4-phosphate cytidylyltransferase/2-C-methyl-D-erythritol 2,4-cyclodiphosphate synthase
VSGGTAVDAVIVAAGTSRRMGGMDKLEARLAGRPLLRWSVDAFRAHPDVGRVVVVGAPDRLDAMRAIDWLSAADAEVVGGGSRRQDSVAAGLRVCGGEHVLVHDAARPLVSAALIGRVIEGVRSSGAAIPVLPLVDALKRVAGTDHAATAAGVPTGGAILEGLDRAGLFRAQTPQGGRRDWLVAAAARHAAGQDEIPDEAELLSRDGRAVQVVEGEAANIKVTLPEDLALARLLAGQGTTRSALGSDSHPFGSRDGLRLGGLLIEEAPALHGHSDGDAVLHAVCDALLGAAGGGDLGRLFPAGERATRGIDSRELLAEVMRRLAVRGLAADSLDVTITGARPRLGAVRLDAMAAALARLTGIRQERVSVKASTGNLAGDEGAGRAISATCLASVSAR